MSPQDLLDRLPSVQELLEHPRVRQAAERWNRSAVAAQLRSAISELGAEVTRRTEPWQGMSAGDLVENLVRRLDPSSGVRPTTAINATGELFPTTLVGPPLPDAAVEAVAAFAAGYTPRLLNAEDELASLVGAEASWVGASHAGALAACLDAIAPDKKLVVARRDVGLLPGGARFETLCRSLGVELIEVGIAEGADPDDYTRAIEQNRADARMQVPVYVRCRATNGGIVQIADAVRAAGGSLIADVASAAPIDLGAEYGVRGPSAAEAIDAGAAVVLLSGDGLLGGPECGVAVGLQESIETLNACGSTAPRRATEAVGAMLSATASLFRDPGRLRFTHPLYRLISAPEDNLRTRAERLAPLVAEHDGVERAAPVEIPPRDDPTCEFAPVRVSWGIAAEGRKGSAENWRQNLQNGNPPVHCRIDQDRLLLDLGTVFPHQDAALVDALA